MDCFHGDGLKPCIFFYFVLLCGFCIRLLQTFEHNSLRTATLIFFMHISHLHLILNLTQSTHVSVKSTFGGYELVVIFQNLRFKLLCAIKAPSISIPAQS